MAFSGTVRVLINGVWTACTYDAATGTYKATITAPSKTSFNEPGGVYVVTAEAMNTAGTTATKTANLTVKETVKPVITIASPSEGAYVQNSSQPIVFTVTDEANGSGVNISSLVVKIDGTAVTSGIVTTEITNGYSVTVTPAGLADGSHTVTVDCEDNDGNAAIQKQTNFTVDTLPPVLNLTSPADGLVTNNPEITVAGTTNDATSSPVTLTINGEAVTVNSNGTFSKTITGGAGSFTIEVVATDNAGRSTTVTRTITIDTSVPSIDSVTIAPNPANTGESMVVTVKVS